MFKIALLLCLVTFSISSQVNISFIIKQAKFLRELEEESFDYPIKSFSYLTSCGIKTSDFALSITYPVNYTLDDSHDPTARFKLKNEILEETIFKSTINNNVQTWTFINANKRDYGYYTISHIKDKDEKTFNYTQITSGFCYSAFCIKSNVDQKILIDKDDDDKLSFRLNYVGNIPDYKNNLHLFASNSQTTHNLTSACTVFDEENHAIQCTFSSLELVGGEDRDKAVSYKVTFQNKDCADQEISTKITLDVVSGNYISLNRFSLVISILIFFLIL